MFAKRSAGDNELNGYNEFFAKRMCVTCSDSGDGYSGGQGGGFLTGYNEHGANDYGAFKK